MGIQSVQDRQFALDLLRDGSLTPEEEDTLMNNIDAYDNRGSVTDTVNNLTIRTDAVPTGNEAIDNAGRTVSGSQSFAGERTPVNYQKDYPELAPDSDEGLILKGAKEGTDYRRGVGFLNQLNMVANAPTPDVQAQVFDEVLEDLAAKLPDGAPMMRYNMDTDEVQYLRQITPEDVAAGLESKGSAGEYRWTSGKSAGLTGSDVARLLNASELGSIIGGVTGSVATRNFTFFKQAGAVGQLAKKGKGFGFKRGLQGSAGESAAGLAGREVGNALRVLHSMGQGRDIDWNNVMAQFPSDLGKEIIAMVGGRAASKALELSKSGIVYGAARLQGMRVVDGTAESALLREAAQRDASEDLEILNKQLDELGFEERITTTRAESETLIDPESGRGQGQTGQKRRLNREQSEKINAGQDAKDALIEREAENMAGYQALADSAGDTRGLNTAQFSPEAANRAIREAETMRVSPVEGSPTQGRVHPQVVGKSADGARDGLRFEIRTDSLDVVSAGIPEEVQRIGLGTEMYRSFLDFAKANGKGARSSAVLDGEDSRRIWEQMIVEGYPIERTPASNIIAHRAPSGDILGYSTRDGMPMYTMKGPEPFISDIVAVGNRSRGVAGSKAARERDAAEFNKLIHSPTAKQLAAVTNEAANNYPQRINMLEQMFKDYDTTVNSGGTFNKAKREEWFDSSRKMMEAVLGPSEYSRIRGGAPGEFRRTFNELAATRDELTTGLSQILKTGNTTAFTNNRVLLSSIRNSDAPTMKRAFRLIRTADPAMFESMQAQLRKEVGAAMSKPVQGTHVTKPGQRTFGKWLTDNQQVLNAAFPDDRFLAKGGNVQYVTDLFAFNRAIARSASAQGSKAQKLVVNTPLLQGARTVMGVMNKWQRRVTAARRVQMQKWYGGIVHVIESPEKLQQLVAFNALEPRLRDTPHIAAQVAVRLGIIEHEDEYTVFQKAVNMWSQWDADKDKDK